jgi:Type I restriction enzyme R protein N terminus (HSDR_N)
MSQVLNLPAFAYQVKKIEDKPYIFDIIRRKYIMLTPEEWVRQHVLHWLINDYKYAKSLIKIETGLQYNSLAKRTDIVVYDRLGDVFMLVECKAPQVALNQSVIDQALRYNAVLKAKYILISNGIKHFIFEINTNSELCPLDNIPLLPLDNF